MNDNQDNNFNQQAQQNLSLEPMESVPPKLARDTSEGEQTQKLSQVDFKIDDIFSYAFDKSNGFKTTFWFAVLLAALVYIPVMALQGGLDVWINGGETNTDPSLEQVGFSLLSQMIVTFITAPIGAGFVIMSLKRIRTDEAQASEVFKHFHKIIPLFLTTILMYLLLGIGFLLFIIPGIYLSIAYFFASFLVVDKNLGPWQALETSRKYVTKHWFTVFLCVAAAGLFNLIALLPLGIGLIWSLPWTALMYAVLYIKVFEDLEV